MITIFCHVHDENHVRSALKGRPHRESVGRHGRLSILQQLLLVFVVKLSTAASQSVIDCSSFFPNNDPPRSFMFLFVTVLRSTTILCANQRLFMSLKGGRSVKTV